MPLDQLLLQILGTGQFAPEYLNAAGARRNQSDDGAQQDRFAGARGADQAEDLALLHVEGDAVENGGAAEADHKIAHPQGDFVRRIGRPHPRYGLGQRHAASYLSMAAKNTAKNPSRTMTRKIDFTTAAVVCRPSDSALPFVSSPSTQAMMPMISAMNGALIMPTMK
jgi:hypothetical protein